MLQSIIIYKICTNISLKKVHKNIIISIITEHTRLLKVMLYRYQYMEKVMIY